MSVKMRQAVERAIVTKLVQSILGAGKRVAVSLKRGYDIEEMLLGSRDEAKILEEAFAGDDCHLFVQPADGPTLEEGPDHTNKGSVVSEGWIYLVFGNDGYDVISDYTTNLEAMLKPAEELAAKLEDGAFTLEVR